MQLRQLVPSLRQTPAAKITSDARRRRYERLHLHAMTDEEIERRTETIAKTFRNWCFKNETIPMYKVNLNIYII